MTDAELRSWVLDALDDLIVMVELPDGRLRWESKDRLVGGLMLTSRVMPARDWQKARPVLERLRRTRALFPGGGTKASAGE